MAADLLIGGSCNLSNQGFSIVARCRRFIRTDRSETTVWGKRRVCIRGHLCRKILLQFCFVFTEENPTVAQVAWMPYFWNSSSIWGIASRPPMTFASYFTNSIQSCMPQNNSKSRETINVELFISKTYHQNLKPVSLIHCQQMNYTIFRFLCKLLYCRNAA